MMTDRDFEIEAEKAIMLLKESTNGLLDLAHLGGMRDEQLRIIKVLEDPYYHHTYFGARGVDDEPVLLHDGECIGCNAIAGIKGENK